MVYNVGCTVFSRDSCANTHNLAETAACEGNVIWADVEEENKVVNTELLFTGILKDNFWILQPKSFFPMFPQYVKDTAGDKKF